MEPRGRPGAVEGRRPPTTNDCRSVRLVLSQSLLPPERCGPPAVGPRGDVEYQLRWDARLK